FRRERSPVAPEATEDQPVGAGEVERQLPDAVRAGDGMGAGFVRGNAVHGLEDGGAVPGLALEAAAELLLEALQLAAHRRGSSNQAQVRLSSSRRFAGLTSPWPSPA